jgi:hypothetical protein
VNLVVNIMVKIGVRVSVHSDESILVFYFVCFAQLVISA